MTNKIINTKDYLVTGESFKISLDEQTGVLKTTPTPNPETLKKYYESRDLVDALRQQLLEEKTLNYLVEHANISIVASKALSQNKDPEKEGN